MTNPNELRQELLSAYLDGNLSSDELARVEQMLEHDPSVVSELDQMRQLQSDLRNSFKMSPRLDAGFGDRVLQAALAQAPAGTQQIAAASPAAIETNRRWLRVGVVVSVAASVMLFLALRVDLNTELADNNKLDNTNAPSGDTDATEQVLAGSKLPASDALPTSDTLPDVVSLPEADATSGTSPALDPSALAVVSPNEMERANTASSSDATKNAATPSVASTAADSNAAVAMSEDVRSDDDVRSDGVPSDTRPQSLAGTEPSSAATVSDKLAFSILLEVELTQRGAELDELGYALHAAGIDNVQPYAMNRQQLEQMVASKAVGASAIDSNQPATGDTQLLLLRGPAKKMDRFMLSLFDRNEVVKRVGFQMVMQRGLVSTIDQLSMIDDASAIRHNDSQAIARRLTFGEDVDHFPHASDASFTTLTRQTASRLNRTVPMPHEDGPDFTTHLLVLVRTN